MNQAVSPAAGSALRQRFVEDMTVRGFSEKTRRDYIRIVAGFAAFLGRSTWTFGLRYAAWRLRWGASSLARSPRTLQPADI